MSVMTNSGYQDIRDHVEATWTYFELRNGSQAPILRLPLSDNRVTWKHLAGSQTLDLEVIIKGSDADVTLPTTFGGAALFKVASGGVALSEDPFTPFTMEATTDQLTLTYRIEIPEVV